MKLAIAIPLTFLVSYVIYFEFRPLFIWFYTHKPSQYDQESHGNPLQVAEVQCNRTSVRGTGKELWAFCFAPSWTPQVVQWAERLNRLLRPEWKIHFFSLWKTNSPMEEIPVADRLKLGKLFDSGRLSLDRPPGLNYSEAEGGFSIRHYNKLMTSSTFWRTLAESAWTTLKIQVDATLCPESPHILEEFLCWDYIGAPWYPESVGWGGMPCCGNGGIAIRNPAALASALDRLGSFDPGTNEDMILGTALSRDPTFYVLPTREQQAQFSIETPHYYPTPLGCHKCWAYLSAAAFANFSRYCPGVVEAMS